MAIDYYSGNSYTLEYYGYVHSSAGSENGYTSDPPVVKVIAKYKRGDVMVRRIDAADYLMIKDSILGKLKF